MHAVFPVAATDGSPSSSSSSSPHPTAPAEALFFDPYRRGMRVLHVFRRNPALSVTLGVPDVPAAASFFMAALGMRVVVPPELSEVHAPPPPPPASGGAGAGADARVVLAFGPAHNTTALVLEPLAAPWGGAVPHGADGGSGDAQGVGVDAAPVLGFAVEDVAAAHARMVAAGAPTSPFAAGEHKSFTAVAPGDYTLHITAAPPASAEG